MITDEKYVVCSVKEPVPLAYGNVYEEGDLWVKIKGCEDCSWENRQKCCGNCPLLTGKGCIPHLEGNKKPFSCVIIPPPDKNHGWCSLEFKCVQGTREGQIRKIREPGNVFD